jgi:hypothetical protein
MAIHTLEGCVVEKSTDYLGELVTDNCFIAAPGQADNQGCHFRDRTPGVFGTSFNSNGGGVYATEWTDDRVSIWMFPRDNIPGDITSGKPNPSTWPKPNARFSGTCDFAKLLKEQRFVS